MSQSSSLPSPYVNPLAYATSIFDSSPLKMDTSMKPTMGGGGGGVYHGYDGNRAGYDLSAYQGTYVPQQSGNHAMQRLDPYSQTQPDQQIQGQRGGSRRRRYRRLRRPRRSRRQSPQLKN